MRDPQASEPFSPGLELDGVIAACYRDSEFLGRTAEFLTYAGAHICVVSGGYRQTLVHYEDHDELELTYYDPVDSSILRGEFLYWPRPKNEKPIGIPVKQGMKPWIREWLDAPRPRSRSRYNQLFDRVGDAAGFQCNPLRFRHTCAVLLYHVLKLDAKTVEKLLGVTSETLTTYVMRPQWMVLEQMRSGGW